VEDDYTPARVEDFFDVHRKRSLAKSLLAML
jgi:hypothetical protein